MRIALGTLNFNYPHSSGVQTDENFRAIVDAYVQEVRTYGQPHPIIDTAYYYGDTETEKTLSRILPDKSVFQFFGKANPWYLNNFQSGRLGQLGRHALIGQFETSRVNLNVQRFDTYFLHAYDYETPLQETLQTCDDLYRKEAFDRFGVSNFSLQQVRDVMNECEHLTLRLTAYQGMYNIVCRKVSPVIDLIHDVPGGSFWAYNPLAGGLLTGKYNRDATPDNSRFKGNAIYQSIFWKAPLLDFVSKMENPLQESLAWFGSIDSKLDRNRDGVILGASNPDQVHTAFRALQAWPTRTYEHELRSIPEDCIPDYCY